MFFLPTWCEYSSPYEFQSLYASALARGEKSVIQLVVYKYFERFPSTDLSAGSSGFVEECPVKKNRKAVLEETKKKNEWKCKWCERFRFKKIDLVSGVFVSIGIVWKVKRPLLEWRKECFLVPVPTECRPKAANESVFYTNNPSGKSQHPITDRAHPMWGLQVVS